MKLLVIIIFLVAFLLRLLSHCISVRNERRIKKEGAKETLLLASLVCTGVASYFLSERKSSLRKLWCFILSKSDRGCMPARSAVFPIRPPITCKSPVK